MSVDSSGWNFLHEVIVYNSFVTILFSEFLVALLFLRLGLCDRQVLGAALLFAGVGWETWVCWVCLGLEHATMRWPLPPQFLQAALLKRHVPV